MNTRHAQPKTSGFTMIELVISSSLVVLILAAGFSCLHGALASQKMISARAEIQQNARIAMRMLSADLRCAVPLTTKTPFLGLNRKLGENEADNLDFGSLNYTPRRLREGDFCEVSYFIDRDPESDTLSLWRRRDPTPDQDPLAGGSREELVRGVHGFSLEYYDGYDWYDEWGDPSGDSQQSNSLFLEPNLFGLPEAVRISLWLQPPPPALEQQRTPKDSENSEPTLLFQTVTHLNLATVSSRTSTSGGETSGQTQSGGESPGTSQSGGRPE